MAVWAGGDDRVVGTTTTTTLLRGGHDPCLSVSFSLLVLPPSLTGVWCLVFTLPPCKMGSSRTDSSHCSMNGLKRRFGTDRKNRDASRKVSGTKEDQVGNGRDVFSRSNPSPFHAWLGDGRTRHHVYHPPGAWPMGGALAAASPLPVFADTKLMSDSCTLFRTYIK